MRSSLEMVAGLYALTRFARASPVVARMAMVELVKSADADADDDEGAPEERAGYIADILYGIYGDDALAALSGQLARQKAWDPQAHPRGPGGRFISRGSPEARGAAEEAIRAAIKQPRKGQSADSVLEHLNIVTAKQLAQMAKEHGVKAPGKLRAQLVETITAKIEGRYVDPATRPPKTPEPGRVYNVATGDLHVDPGRFQFKLNTEAGSGVTQELKSVKTWNPDFAGVVSVWQDPADGKTYVVNGHHRRELAGRLDVKDLAVRYITAGSAKEARAIGALVNIAEGRGTAVDAAKFMRDSGSSPQDLEERGVSLRGKLAADAAILTKLSNRAFDSVARGTLEESKALAVARHLPDHDLQNQLFSRLEKREEEGKDMPIRAIEEMARLYAAAPRVQESGGGGLFQMDPQEVALIEQRAEVQSWVRAQMASEVNNWLAVASKRRAERVSGAGNVLNVEENRRLAQEADRAKNVFDSLALRKGPISDAMNAAAEEMYHAKTKKERDEIKENALEAVKQAILAELGTEPGGTGPGGEGGTGAGAPEPAGGTEATPAHEGRGDTGTAGLTPPEPGFTGVDANGHHWVDGQQVAQGEEGIPPPEPPVESPEVGEQPKAPEAPAESKPPPDARPASDGTRRGADGMVWARAPAGGAISPVNGRHYAGGRWMPIHGLSEPQDKRPAGAGRGEKPVPASEEGRGKPRAPRPVMSPEQIAEEKTRRENEKKWEEVRGSELGTMLAMGERPHRLRSGVLTLKPWKEYAESVGEEGLQRLMASIEPLLEETWQKESREPLTDEDRAYLRDQVRENAASDARLFSGSGKHLRATPSSFVVRQMIQDVLRSASVSELARVNDAMIAAKAGPKEPPKTLPKEPPTAAAPEKKPAAQAQPAAETKPAPSPRVQSALDRFAARDQHARGGGLFGGEDLQARQGFARLPDDTPIVFTEGEFAGRTGRIVHDQDRIVATVDGRPGNVSVTPETIEPLDARLSWRTAAGAHAGAAQSGLFGGAAAQAPAAPREVHPDVAAVRDIQRRMNEIARSGKTGLIDGVPVQSPRVGEFSATINGQPVVGDLEYVARRIHDARRRREQQAGKAALIRFAKLCPRTARAALGILTRQARRR